MYFCGSGNGCPLPLERGESIAKGASRLPFFSALGYCLFPLKTVPASDNHESRMGKMPTKWLSEPLSLGQRLLFMIWYILDSGRWDRGGVRYARYSRNRVFTITTSVERYSPRQNLLVGRSEIGTFSKAGKVVGAMHGLAG